MYGICVRACHCDPYNTHYKAILDKHIPPKDRLRLQQDVAKWKESLVTYKQFWTEQ